MPKKLVIVLGNGFSLDFLTHIGQSADIDVSNLFRYGSLVPWPADNEPGFLSHKRCPHLWNLGARPNMGATEAMALIEDIITCVNVFVSVPDRARSRSPRSREGRPNDLYIFAYKELALYLKHLFVYYDKKLAVMPASFKDWPWLTFLRDVTRSPKYDRITIVTYNYDVWLERALTAGGVPFSIGTVESRPYQKLVILKPHGSISFAHKTVRDKQAFAVSLNYELLDGSANDFIVQYNDLDENYLVNALIPPAAESGRFNHTWAGQIRLAAKEAAAELGSEDELLLCGLSYWHVDRAELDELLTACNPSTNIKMINPKPLRAMDAVITSVFDNYISYSSNSVLESLVL